MTKFAISINSGVRSFIVNAANSKEASIKALKKYYTDSISTLTVDELEEVEIL